MEGVLFVLSGLLIAGTLDYMAPEVLVCPDKRAPEENKDKALLAYTSQVCEIWVWTCI